MVRRRTYFVASLLWLSEARRHALDLDDAVSLIQVKQTQLVQHDAPSVNEFYVDRIKTYASLRTASQGGLMHTRALSMLDPSPTKRNAFGVPEDDGSPCVAADDGLTSCDFEGKPCMLCGTPLPGRGYDGKMHKSSELKSEADLDKLPKGDFVLRDDCGSVKRELDFFEKFSDHVRKIDEPHHYPAAMNAWCDLNMQVISANAFANKDLLFQGKTIRFEKPMKFDFNFCKKNGWLSRETQEAIAGGYESGLKHARKFCAEKVKQTNVTDMKWGSFLFTYFPIVARDDPVPTQDEANLLGAWPCAMGGSDGRTGAESDGPAADMGFCTYTFGDLGNGDFCMYDECEGWDPVKGMPVTDLAARKS
jgi:hypothetical protein